MVFIFLILEKLKSLPFKKVAHQVTTMDAQPIIGVDNNQAVALMVTGKIFIFNISFWPNTV